MDLKSGYPFWSVKNGLLHAFPPLASDVNCDVAILGGGITGALIADELCTHGHDVAVVDQRDVGWGSTAASTALLQYEIDTHMIDLARQYGQADAVLAYRACLDAIPMLGNLAHEIAGVDFATMDSLYYASKRRHRSTLEDEFAMRSDHGFPVEWLDADAVETRFGIRAPCAILSTQAARIDPYRMAYKLLKRLENKGGQVFDRTFIDKIVPDGRGVSLHSSKGACLRAKHLVIAAGYASQDFIDQDVAVNRSSYAFITDPIDPTALGQLQHTMMWESARPYLYFRTTGDNRLLVGGEDDAVDVPAKRDAAVDRKARKLVKKIGKIFPDLKLDPAFSWAGTFAETQDGLPFFGRHPQTGSRILFAMAYGGNGITYSMLGAGLLRSLIERRAHPLKRLFSFDRIQ